MQTTKGSQRDTTADSSTTTSFPGPVSRDMSGLALQNKAAVPGEARRGSALPERALALRPDGHLRAAPDGAAAAFRGTASSSAQPQPRSHAAAREAASTGEARAPQPPLKSHFVLQPALAKASKSGAGGSGPSDSVPSKMSDARTKSQLSASTSTASGPALNASKVQALIMQLQTS